jgi:hypothetical protein
MENGVPQRAVTFIVSALCLSMLAACGRNGSSSTTAPSPSSQTTRLFQGRIAASAGGRPTVAAIAVDMDGSVVSALSSDGMQLDRALYTSPDRRSMTVWMRPDGRPGQAMMEDTLVMFENYTDTTVDVAIVGPDKQVRVARDVSLGSIRSPRSGRPASTSSGGGTRADVSPNASTNLKTVANALDAAGCVAATAGAVGSGGAAIPIAALACQSQVVEILKQVGAIDEPALNASSDAMGTITSAYGCFGSKTDALDCLAAALIAAVKVAEDRERALQEEKEKAEEELKKKTVDVTGTWNGTVVFTGGETVRVTFMFSQTGRNLSGTYFYEGRVRCATISGTVVLDLVTFTLTPVDGCSGATGTVRATVTGNTMAGTVSDTGVSGTLLIRRQ